MIEFKITFYTTEAARAERSSVKSAWSMQQILGQPGLNSNTLLTNAFNVTKHRSFAL